MTTEFWRDRRVLLTGHTGFKGGWLSLWLHSLGARVYGYALEAPTSPNIFGVARVSESLSGNTIADIRDSEKLTNAIRDAKPEVVFHMAAQSLVRYSYTSPIETFEVNVMGTVRLLDAVRANSGVRAVVNITTDKCYENREWHWGYREDEPLGGYDPYSSSKACSELATAAYRRSFLEAAGVAVASARAGNVIGGGDWANDRLLPDFLRAVDAGEVFKIRSPDAIRPWQHVLDPLSGYLTLAEQLMTRSDGYAEAWNFGPADEDSRNVRWIAERLVRAIDGAKWASDAGPQPHEAGLLKLDSSKARTRLSWRPRWGLSTAVDKTLEWHDAWRSGKDMQDFSLRQIAEYLEWDKDKVDGTNRS